MPAAMQTPGSVPQGGRVEIGAPTGRWQLVVVYRGKHDPVCVTYLAALQVGRVGGWGLQLRGPGQVCVERPAAAGAHPA